MVLISALLSLLFGKVHLETYHEIISVEYSRNTQIEVILNHCKLLKYCEGNLFLVVCILGSWSPMDFALLHINCTVYRNT